MLPPRSTCPIDLDLKILIAKIDFNVAFDLGVHEYRCEGSVTPACSNRTEKSEPGGVLLPRL